MVGSKGARAYHGGMTHGQRRTVHHAFIRDELQARVVSEGILEIFRTRLTNPTVCQCFSLRKSAFSIVA